MAISALLLLASTPLQSGAAVRMNPNCRLVASAHWSKIDNSAYNVHTFTEYKKFFDFKPEQVRRVLTAKDLQVFLPPTSVKVGDIWKMKDDGLINLLKQFHPRPTTRLHHMTGAGGGFASLTGRSPQLAEISFRFHAEFELEPKKIWFTPSQFSGHLVIDRRNGTVRSFRLYVPDVDTNFDINVPTAADIGYIPRMELRGGDFYDRNKVNWSSSVPVDKTSKEMAKKFYAFAQIDWLPLKQALIASRQKVKPLHIVILFGALENESC